VREALGRLPGVTAVGVASHLPRLSAFPEALEVEGVEELMRAPLVRQGPGVFEVLGVEPLLGRLLDERDVQPGALPVAVVNQAFALERFGTSRALGRRVRLAPDASEAEPRAWHEIVGVVPNVMEVTGTGAAGVYLPLEPMTFFSVALLVDAGPMSLAGGLRRTLFDLDPRLDVREVVRLDDVGSENRTALWAMSAAMGAIGAITLLLSVAGIYSIVSLAVSLRTREIGVRVALGAERGAILRQVLGRAALLLGAGGAVGVLLGVQVTRARIFVFALPGVDVQLFLGLAAVLGLAGLAACWIPARRALSIQPVEALQAGG
jgi:hypothetical protein